MHPKENVFDNFYDEDDENEYFMARMQSVGNGGITWTRSFKKQQSVFSVATMSHLQSMYNSVFYSHV